MVRIRLRRLGAKKQPAYRIVVADSRAPRDGRFIEIIGHYNPRTEPPRVVVREDRALYWLSQGAQPSGPVAAFFAKLGLPEKLAQVRSGAAIESVAAPPAQDVTPSAVSRRRRTLSREEAAGESVAEGLGPSAAEPAVAAEPVLAEEPAIVAEAKTVEEPAAAPAAVAADEPAVAPAPPPADVTAASEELGLSPRVAKALSTAGIASLDELRALLAAGDESLLQLPGIGAKAVDEIRARLAELDAAKEA